MDWFGLGKHIFTFGSTGFDIGSDIVNSLSFLGVFNNETYNNINSISLNNLSYHPTTHPTLPCRETNELIDCATMDQREDVIWGVLSLLIVFLPGYIVGISFLQRQLGARNWSNAFMWVIVGIPLLSVVFPLIVLGLSFIVILWGVSDSRYGLEDLVFTSLHFVLIGFPRNRTALNKLLHILHLNLNHWLQYCTRIKTMIYRAVFLRYFSEFQQLQF